MKKTLLLSTVLLFAFFFSVNAEYIRGGFYNNSDAWGAYEMSPFPAESPYYYEYSFEYTAADASNSFKITKAEDNWDDQWGLGVNPELNTSKGVATKSGNDLSVDLKQDKFYLFKIKGLDHWTDRDLLVFETDNTPVSIDIVTDNSATTVKDVEISITLSAAPSSQETIYVRYTTDSWSTSHLVAATGSGADYSATIEWGGAVQYYVMTSTFPISSIESDYDLYFLNRNTNDGSNYVYNINEGVYQANVVLRKTSGLDYIDQDDFDGSDLGEFTSVDKLHLTSFQVLDYLWSSNVFASATASYRLYELGSTPPDFTTVPLPWHSEWESAPMKQMWWNDQDDTISVDLISGLENGTYNLETYFSMTKNGTSDVLYLNNGGSNYIATFVINKTSTAISSVMNSAMKVIEHDNSLIIELSSTSSQELTVSLISLSGQTVSSTIMSVETGVNTLTLLKPNQCGVFILKMDIGEQTLVEKVILK